MASPLDMIRTLGLPLQVFDYASYTDDVGIEWRKWLRSFETMIRASRIDDEEWKKDLLLHYAGPSIQQLYETLPGLPETDMRGPLLNVERYTPNMTSYDEAKAKLNEFFLPKENSTYERHLLCQIRQKSGGYEMKPHVSDINKVDVTPYSDRRKRFAEPNQFKCHRCGYVGHQAKDDKCPARGKLCNKCGGRDHFARKCRSKQVVKTDSRFEHSTNWKNPRKIVQDDDSQTVKHIIGDSISDKTEYIFNVIPCDSDGEMRFKIGGVPVSVVIDSGSKYNVRPQQYFGLLLYFDNVS